MPGIADFLQGMFRPPPQPGAQAPANAPMNPFAQLQQWNTDNPGVLSSIGAGMMSGDMGGGFEQAGKFRALAQAQQQEQAEKTRTNNLTRQWLMSKRGLTEADADAAMANPAILSDYLKGGKEGQGFINAGGGHLFNSETGEWVSAPGGGSDSRAGLQVTWLRDKDGNLVPGQLTQDGKILASELPEGYTSADPYDPAFQRSAGSAAGKGVGEAQLAVPTASMTAQRVSEQVESLKSDPYLDSMLGPLDSRLPNISSDAARVQGKIDQLSGGAFLEARQALKGGGAITDFESQKAEAAYTRMQTAQSPKDFKDALDEFNRYVQEGLRKLESQASITPNTVRAPAQGGGNRMRFDANGNPL